MASCGSKWAAHAPQLTSVTGKKERTISLWLVPEWNGASIFRSDPKQALKILLIFTYNI